MKENGVKTAISCEFGQRETLDELHLPSCLLGNGSMRAEKVLMTAWIMSEA